MPRRLALLLMVGLTLSPLSPAQTFATREPTLRERLVAGLSVRRDSEYDFIDAVVATVDRGELPAKLVDRMFFWARTRAPKSGRQRPIIYFQPGLTRVAQKLGITITADPAETVASAG